MVDWTLDKFWNDQEVKFNWKAKLTLKATYVEVISYKFLLKHYFCIQFLIIPDIEVIKPAYVGTT